MDNYIEKKYDKLNKKTLNDAVSFIKNNFGVSAKSIRTFFESEFYIQLMNGAIDNAGILVYEYLSIMLPLKFIDKNLIIDLFNTYKNGGGKYDDGRFDRLLNVFDYVKNNKLSRVAVVSVGKDIQQQSPRTFIEGYINRSRFKIGIGNIYTTFGIENSSSTNQLVKNLELINTMIDTVNTNDEMHYMISLKNIEAGINIKTKKNPLFTDDEKIIDMLFDTLSHAIDKKVSFYVAPSKISNNIDVMQQMNPMDHSSILFGYRCFKGNYRIDDDNVVSVYRSMFSISSNVVSFMSLNNKYKDLFFDMVVKALKTPPKHSSVGILAGGGMLDLTKIEDNIFDTNANISSFLHGENSLYKDLRKALTKHKMVLNPAKIMRNLC